MAIGFRAFSSGDIAAATATTTPGKPTGFASTDILIQVVATDFGSGRTNNVVTFGSGWTAINTGFVVTDVNSNHIALYAAWALGSVASTQYTNSQTGANYQQGWVNLAFTGVDNVTPIDSTPPATSSSTAAASVTAATMTPTTTGAIKVIPVCGWIGGTYSGTGLTPKQNAGANADASCVYDLTALTAAVATGTTSVSTTGGATNQILAVMPFLLRPAAGGATNLFPTQRKLIVNQSIVRASNW